MLTTALECMKISSKCIFLEMIINGCPVNEVCYFLFGILGASQVCKIQAKFAEKKQKMAAK